MKSCKRKKGKNGEERGRERDTLITRISKGSNVINAVLRRDG
jgi:hypothetical protein